MTLVLLACLLLASQNDRAKIYIGTDPSRVIGVDASKLGKALDVGYDEVRKLLYVYSERSDGQYVMRWAPSGRLLADWRLPKDFGTPSALCVYRGQVALRSWDEASHKNIDLLFPENGSDRFKIGDLGNYYSVSPKTTDAVTQIRDIMRNLGWTPFAHVGVHIINAEPLIKDFMCTNPFRDERIAWTSDYSVVSYSWDDGSPFELAVKDHSGSYVDRDIFKQIVGALGWSPSPTNRIYLYSITVSRSCAAYGLQLTSPDHKVACIDLTAPDWRVQRTETGYLARTMIEIGY